jgi:O-antigen/teichoic acid export membrane protein
LSNVKSSLFWSFLDKYLGLASNIVVNIVLSRLLTPNDIGIFSIASSLIGFAGMLRDFGVATYLIQEKDLTLSRQRTAVGVQVVIAWTIGGTLAIFSGLIGDFYNNPGVRQVVQVLAINFFLIPFGTVVITLLRREMNFGALYRMGVVINLSRSIAAIGLATLGFGFMAMAWSSVVGLIATVIMAYFEHPAAGVLLPSLKEWRHVISFGTKSTVAQMLTEVRAAAPDVLIGRIINPVAVGMFSRANGITVLFSQGVLEGLAPVALSAIAKRHREGSDYRSLLLQSLTHITALGWPFFCFVAFLAYPITRILFGDQWDDAVPIMRFLCIAAIVRLLDSMTFAVLQGTGSIGKYVILQLVTVPLQVAFLATALLLGRDLEAVGWAMIAGAAVQVTMSLAFLRVAAKVSLGDIFGAVSKSILLAIASSIAPLIVVLTMTIAPGHLWVPLLLGAIGSGTAFLAAAFSLKHPLAEELKKLGVQGWRAVFA